MAKESVYFHVDNLNGKHGVKQIKQKLDEIHGVISVSVNPESHAVAVDYDSTGVSPGRIAQSLDHMGFKVTAEKEEKHMM